MEGIKVIVFDADNCIFLDEHTREGSEEIKDRAWFEVFSEYEASILAPVLEDVKQRIAGGKGDRRDIAVAVLTHFEFPKESLDAMAAQKCEQFNSIVREDIEHISISDEVRMLLLDLSQRFPVYLNTATPYDAIMELLQTMRLDMFKGVYGRPGTKIEHLRTIADIEQVPFSQILFVGDTQSDCDAATEVGCRFVGIRTKRNSAWHKPQAFKLVDSLRELEYVVQ